jgi:hypothetical protein
MADLLMLGFAKLLCHFSLSNNLRGLAAGNQAPLPSPTDVLKPFFIYLQFMFVVATMPGISWPGVMSVPLQGLTWLFSSSTPHSLSWECIMSRDGAVPVPVQVLALSLTMPFVLMALLLLFESALALYRTRRRVMARSTALRKEYQKLVAEGIVLWFLFYPMLLREVLGMFACLTLDQAADAPYQPAAVGSFWERDMSQRCWQGYHRTIALALGASLTGLLTVLVPGAMLLFLLHNRRSLYSTTFQHFWFLYHMYRPSVLFWEAVVIVQTAALVSISIFGFAIGTYYACLALTTVLALTMVVHAWARPFANAMAGNIALRGLACVCFTSFAALSFLPPGTRYGQEGVNQHYAMVAGAIVLLINVAYIVSVGVQLFRLIDWGWMKKLRHRLPTMRIRCGCCQDWAAGKDPALNISQDPSTS